MKNANATNVSQYKKLPKSEREVFGFWYRLPRLYEVGGGRFEDYWRENYPIQFRLRETCENVYISMSVFKRKLIENVWERIFPKNQWARNANLKLIDLSGISYNPINETFKLSRDVSVNYMMHFIKN